MAHTSMSEPTTLSSVVLPTNWAGSSFLPSPPGRHATYPQHLVPSGSGSGSGSTCSQTFHLSLSLHIYYYDYYFTVCVHYTMYIRQEVLNVRPGKARPEQEPPGVPKPRLDVTLQF